MGDHDDIVYAATAWPSNAELIADVARLGYLHQSWPTLDTTYGRGTFWKVWRPDRLVTHNYRRDGVDFRHLPHPDGSFLAVVIDAPFKLNGRSTAAVDARYGVDEWASWRERHLLIKSGMTECTRVLAPKGHLLVKCQDQVCGGKVRWQGLEFANHGTLNLKLDLVDRFDLLTRGRSQPERRRTDGKPSIQGHARRNGSTLLVFRKAAR